MQMNECWYRKCNKALLKLSGIPENAAERENNTHEVLAKLWEVVGLDIYNENYFVL